MLQRPMARTSCGSCCAAAPASSGSCTTKRRALSAVTPTRGASVRYSYATHLECSLTGQRATTSRKLQGLSQAGKPLLVRYDLAALRRELTREVIAARAPTLWRWHELLPVPAAGAHRQPGRGRDAARAAGEQRAARRLSRAARQGRGPAAHRLLQGARAVPGGVDGEACTACAASPFRPTAMPAPPWLPTRRVPGMEAFCFCPEDTPEINLSEIALQGAHVWRVNGLINDCAPAGCSGARRSSTGSTCRRSRSLTASRARRPWGWSWPSSSEWQLPQVVFYPTGGGTGLIGMWKAWQELAALGWIRVPLPRLVAVQASGCAPIVRAFEAGASRATLGERAHRRRRHPRASCARGFPHPAAPCATAAASRSR